MQKRVNLVDLVKSFPTSINLQKSASIQPRTSPSKFGEKFNSLFTSLLGVHKADGAETAQPRGAEDHGHSHRRGDSDFAEAMALQVHMDVHFKLFDTGRGGRSVLGTGRSTRKFRWSVLGFIEGDFCKEMLTLQHFSRARAGNTRYLSEVSPV